MYIVKDSANGNLISRHRKITRARKAILKYDRKFYKDKSDDDLEKYNGYGAIIDLEILTEKELQELAH